jgi:hypothetical protein
MDCGKFFERISATVNTRLSISSALSAFLDPWFESVSMLSSLLPVAYNLTVICLTWPQVVKGDSNGSNLDDP